MHPSRNQSPLRSWICPLASMTNWLAPDFALWYDTDGDHHGPSSDALPTLLFKLAYPFTIKACMTPGIHPIKVKTMLISKVVPTPCFIKTAKGGKRMLRTIVKIDISIAIYRTLLGP